MMDRTGLDNDLDLVSYGSYQRLVDEFEWDIDDRVNIARRILDGRSTDTRPALIVDDGPGVEAEVWSFADLHRHTAHLGSLLRALGVERGDRVGLSLPQGPDLAAAHLAVYALGAVAVPMSLIYGSETYRHIVADSGARVVLVAEQPATHIRGERAALPELVTLVTVDGTTDGGHEEPPITSSVPSEVSLAAALASVDAEPLRCVDTAATDPALLLYTSGTTGPPKGALHGHRILDGYLLTYLLFFDADLLASSGSGLGPVVLWTPSDWAWVGGLLDILLPGLLLGCPIVATSGRFSPAGSYDLLARHQITHIFLAPTALKMMAQVPEVDVADVVALKVIASGGEAVAAGLHEWAAERFGAVINEFYGLTEVNHLAGSCDRLWPSKPGSMGLPYPGRIVDVVDADGRPVPAGQTGEIVVRPGDPTQMLRYWNNPEATTKKYRNGWMLTGDLAHRDDDGYLYFHGRDDDIISSAGHRIGPAEIEELILTMPEVAEVAVVGKPDETRGAIVKAFVELADGIVGDDELVARIQDLVRTRLGAYKYPREVEFTGPLPKTVTGKLNRKQLSERG